MRAAQRVLNPFTRVCDDFSRILACGVSPALIMQFAETNDRSFGPRGGGRQLYVPLPPRSRSPPLFADV